MMTFKKAFDKVKKGIEDGIYRTVRLVQIDTEGERKVIVPYSKLKLPEALERMKYIQNKVNSHGLTPGNYTLEAKSDFRTSGMTDSFDFVIAPKIIHIPSDLSDAGEKTVTPLITESMSEMDMEELKQLYKENADLRAEVKFYRAELERVEGELRSKQGLSDAAPQVHPVLSAVKEFAPGILALADKYFENQDRKLTLAENAQKNGFKKVAKRKEPGVWKGLTYQQLLSELDNLDDDQLEIELEEIQEKDPDLYAQVYPEFYEEEGEEQQQGEEEQGEEGEE